MIAEPAPLLAIGGGLMLATLGGTALGTVTGLMPGLHVNTLLPILVALATLAPDPALGLLLVLAIATTHTLLNVIPTLAAPIPDEETSLTLLPLQRLAQQGQSTNALRVSVRASWAGGTLILGLGALVLLVWQHLPAPPTHITAHIVLTILLWMIVRHPRPLACIVLFGIASAAGVVLLPLSIPGPFGGDGAIMMPVFAGFFGIPLLLLAASTRDMEQSVGDADPPKFPGCEPVATAAPPSAQQDEGHERGATRGAIFVGSFCGGLVSLLPGMTSATAGAFGRMLRASRDDLDDVAMLSAVDTANAVGNAMVFFLLGTTRSGASIAMARIAPQSLGAGASLAAGLAIMALCATLWLAALIALRIGPRLIDAVRRIPARTTAIVGLGLVCAITYAATGLLGLAILAAMTPLGFLPHRWRVPRSLLMGFVLGPYLIGRFT